MPRAPLLALCAVAAALNPLKVCHHKTCSKNGLAKRALDAGSCFRRPRAVVPTAACQSGCNAGTVSVVGRRLYDVEKASAAASAAILEIGFGVVVSDAAVDACDKLAAADAAQRRGDKDLARKTRALLDGRGARGGAAPRAAAVCLFDRGGQTEQRGPRPVAVGAGTTRRRRGAWRRRAGRGATGASAKFLLHSRTRARGGRHGRAGGGERRNGLGGTRCPQRVDVRLRRRT